MDVLSMMERNGVVQSVQGVLFVCVEWCMYVNVVVSGVGDDGV